MNISIEPGKYVVAVSGGVDSVVLLHLLREVPGLKLTVAHFDHGIREDSREDRRFVRGLAAQHGLPYVFAEGRLGPKASEAAARQARYEFLHKVREAAGADAVLTAHHQDDVLETAILNIVRGTGRRGLSSLRSTELIKRPLLHVPKADIITYARENQLSWREDSTNMSAAYRRNHIRHNVLSRFSSSDRARLHDIITRAQLTNRELDALLEQLLTRYTRDGRLDRHWFIMLPHMAALEVMAAWLRARGIPDIDRKMLERLTHAAKTFTAGRLVSVTMDWSLLIEKELEGEAWKGGLALMRLER